MKKISSLILSYAINKFYQIVATLYWSNKFLLVKRSHIFNQSDGTISTKVPLLCYDKIRLWHWLQVFSALIGWNLFEQPIRALQTNVTLIDDENYLYQ